MRLERVDHQVEELGDFGLEGHLFAGVFGHGLSFAESGFPPFISEIRARFVVSE